MSRAGFRTDRIVFERATLTTDDYGTEIPSWASWAPALASVRYGTGSERRQAAVERGGQAATFRVLATAKTRAVGIADRIVFGGYAWDIEGIAPIGRSEIELTALRGAAVIAVTPPANDVGALDFSDPNNSALLALFEFSAPPVSDASGMMDFSQPDNSGLLAVL